MQNNIDNLLVELNACDEAIDWANGKTWPEIYNTCHRGDWLLWLFNKTNPDDLQLLTLAKGHCANTVRHLMRNDMSIKAVDAAIAFGEGKIGLDELKAAAVVAAYADRADAYVAARDTSARAAYYASFAATTAAALYADASNAAGYTAAAASAAYAYTADAAYTSADAVDVLKKNQQETADICRKYLPIEIWNIK